MLTRIAILLTYIIGISTCLNQAMGQDGTSLDKALTVPDKLFITIDKQAGACTQKLDKQSAKYLSKLQKQENKLRKKIWKKDSALAKQLFDGVEEKYAQLKNASGAVNKYSSVYSGHLDSLTTSLNFLKDQNLINNAGLEKSLEQYQGLQNQLNKTETIKKYVGERQRLLKEQLEQLGMVKELKNFQKQAYYYQAQIAEYKALIEDPSKLEQKLMEAVLKVPQFKEFFAKNSQLGALFALPGGSEALPVSLAGLQTRASVNQALVDRFGREALSPPAGGAGGGLLQQNMQAAQGELNQLKSKLSQYSSGSYGNNSTDITMPEGARPNTQKTKSLLQRLEYGTNIQTGRGSRYFPVTSDLGLSLGYKLNDKSIIGVGASYKLGWGSSWSNIQLTHQGVGLRSYIDMKAPFGSPNGGVFGGLYISGGYEQNYRPELKNLNRISPSGGGGRGEALWQSSGLIGLSKKYQISSRRGKGLKGEMKLLWDFLSYQQVPRTQAVVFRVGYNLK